MVGAIENENLPGGRVEFTIDLKMNDKQELSGTIVSPQGDSEIVEWCFQSRFKKNSDFEAENENSSVIEIQADVEGEQMIGTMSS